jgi:hypothetical protein
MKNSFHARWRIENVARPLKISLIAVIRCSSQFVEEVFNEIKFPFHHETLFYFIRSSRIDRHLFVEYKKYA